MTPPGRRRPNAPSSGSSAATTSALPLYDSGSGGCRDGLHQDRVNENQGAESTLAFQLSLAEMSGARPPGVAPAGSCPMSPIHFRRREIMLLPDSSRVIIRPFIPANDQRVTTIIGRALALSEAEAEARAGGRARRVRRPGTSSSTRFGWPNFERVPPASSPNGPCPARARLLIGALFSGEYALESAALFNPSMVPHPDQAGVEGRALRFIMSLRATGEGHISSDRVPHRPHHGHGEIRMDEISRCRERDGHRSPTPIPQEAAFRHQTARDGFRQRVRRRPSWTRCGRTSRAASWTSQSPGSRGRRPAGDPDLQRTLRCIHWLADSNYEMQFPPRARPERARASSPTRANESNGIEDARFVRFSRTTAR